MIQKLVKAIKILQFLLVGLIIIILSYPLIIASNYQLIFRNKIYPKIKIIDLDLAGRTKEEALEIVKQKIQKSNLKFLLIEYKNQKWEIDLSQFNLQYLPQQTVNKAYNFGRDKDLVTNLWTKWQAWQKGVIFPLDYQIDKNLLEEKIATIAGLINIPAVPPTIEIKNYLEKTVIINPEKPGKMLNEGKLLNLIDERLKQLNNEKISLPVEDIPLQVNLSEIEETKSRAQNLLNKKVKLMFKENQWELEDKEVINFLSFKTEFDEERINSYLEQLTKAINQPPQNALFNFSQGRVIEFKPAQEGQELDKKRTQELLVDAFRGLEKTENKIAIVTLPVTLIKAKISNEEVNNLGIKQLIGRGESWFRGSISSRIHNINLAAQKLNGLLIAPQETFSFNQALGDVSLQTGFKQAYIIKEGKTVLGDGGGVCQVSTTLFRAALNAGLPIVERRAHAYRVAYYEQNYQPGIDATVFDPSPDLKFTNDTPTHILIQSYLDNQNLKLTFALYGTSDGREVSISPSRIWDQTPPPPDLYQDDPTSPLGVIKQVDWKSWGAKVAFDWKVVRGNEVLQERTFYSYYQPWQAVFLKGTGG